MDPNAKPYACRGREGEPPIRLAASVGRLSDRPMAADPPPSGGLHISLHDHVVCLPESMTPENWARYRAWGREAIGYPGLAQSGLTGVFHSMLAAEDMPSVIRWATLLRTDMAHHPATVVAASAVADLDHAQKAGKTAVFLALEAATPVGRDLDNIEILYGLGIRSMGLTYNRKNALGDGLMESPDDGLTPTGRAAIRLMEDLGILVDLAHVGDRTAMDALAVCRKPAVISHAGARTLWPTRRMKPDDVIRECASRGGVIGIEAAPHTTLTSDHPRHNLDAFMAHFEYCTALVGIENVAFGPDTLFGDHVGLHRLNPSAMPAPPHETVEYVAGLENPGEAFHNIQGWLKAHGYSASEQAAVLGDNVRRVMAATIH